jgi:hypothetical protein
MSSINESSISASSIASAIEFAGGEAPRRYSRGFRGAGPPFPNSRLHDKATDSTDRNKAAPREAMYRRWATHCPSCAAAQVGNPGQHAIGIGQGISRMPSHCPGMALMRAWSSSPTTLANLMRAVRSLPRLHRGLETLRGGHRVSGPWLYLLSE